MAKGSGRGAVGVERSATGCITSTRGRRPNGVTVAVSIALVVVLALPLPHFLDPSQHAAKIVAKSPNLSPAFAPALTAGPSSGGPIGVPLSAGKIQSAVIPTVDTPDSHSFPPPRFTNTSTSYSYVTGFGNYSFPESAPYVMDYTGAGAGNAVQWSAFLVGTYTGGLATPMRPSNATILQADNQTFVVAYQTMLRGIPQGTLVVHSVFSADVAPTFEADYSPLPNVTTDFNVLWAIAGAPPFLEGPTGQGQNIGSYSQLQWQPWGNVSATLGPSPNASNWPWSVKVDWSDAGAGDLYSGPIAPFGSSFGSGIYVQFAKDRASIDPTIIGSSAPSTVAPTGFSSERKTFYWNGLYRAFWDTGSGIAVESSPDGKTWNSNGGTLTSAINPGFDVAERGTTVALGYVNSGLTGLYVRVGTINANQIAWNNSVPTPTFGNMSRGVGPVSVTIGADKEIYIAAAWQGAGGNKSVSSCDNNSNPCYHDYIFRSTTPSGSAFSLIGNYIASGSTAMAVLDPVPNGTLFVAFTNQSTAFISWAIWTGSWEYRFSNGTIKPSGETSTSNGDPALQTGNTAYEMVPVVASTNGWVYIAYMTSASSIAVVSIVYGTPPPHYYTETAATCPTCLGGPYVPALGIDSLNALYLFWDEQASSTIWDIDYAYQTGALRGFGGLTGPNLLYAAPSGYTPRKLSAGLIGSNAATLLWTQDGWANGSHAIYFAALPLPTVLGGSPNQPSSRDGLSPYGAYFQQMNEYVGPGNGLLDVAQSDVNLPGRGLSLSVGRIFDEPRDFLSITGSPIPFLFDNFTGADLGVGWSLTIPWVGTYYLHLPDGEEYPLQFNTTGVYINRAGTGFALTQNVNCVGRVCTPTGYTLNLSNGVTVLFGASGLPTSETDLTGQNTISFTYAGPNGQLSKITDTVGRSVNLTYNSHNQLQSISWAGRSEQLTYSSTTATADLTSVLDPLSRNTSFSYLTGNPWMMTEVGYPTGGHTNYTYRSASFGEATCYLVSLQNVYNGTALVRSTNFSYDFINGAVTYSKLNISNATGLQGSVSYSFGAPVGSMAVTEFDASGHQLQRTVTWYDPSGRPTQTDTYSGNTTTPTSSTYQAFDDWGNLIYTRDAVGHESFASYANTNYTKTFYSPGLLTRTASARIWSDDFSNHSLNDWAISSPIQVTLDDTANPPQAPSVKILSSSSVSAAYAYHTFATQTHSFVAEALIQPDPSGQAVWFNLTSGGLGSALVSLEFVAGVLDYCNPTCHSSGASYSPGRWVLVAVSADDVAQKYAIWLAGVEYVPGTSFSSTGNINGLVISTRDSTGPASVYADNVRVYSNPSLQITGIDPDSTVDIVSAIDGTTVAFPVGTDPYIGVNTLQLNFRIYLIEVFNQSGGSTPEYTSPSTDFSGGDNYSYTLPVWRGGQFYSSSLPTTVHSVEVGSMTWQNGSTDPVMYLDMSTIQTSGFLRDMSGHGNTAALHGPTSASGIAGQARSFDGSTNYMSVPDSQSLEPSTFTVSFWIKPTSWPTTSGLHTRVIAKDIYNGTGGVYRGWIVLWDPVLSTSTVGKLYLAAFSTASQESDSPRVSLVKNVWQQVTFSFDGTHLHGYLNGTEVAPAGTMTGTYGPSNHTLVIGKGDNSGFFNGSLDELRIYNRALSPEEIGTLATLSLWFDMETFSSTGTLVDMSGFQGSGTAVSTTVVRGKVGDATSFNGASSYVNVSTSGNVSRNFTVDAWVEPASAGSGTTYSFFTTRSGTNGYTFDAMLQNGNKIHGEIGTGSAWLTTSADYTFTYHANVWYNVAYVVTTTGYSIYVNGTLATTGTYSASVPLLWDTTHQVSIGGDWNSTSHTLSEAFSGSIDEVKVWRGALSSSQIASLFSAQSSPPTRSFYDYNSLGENIADKTYHNDTWLYTNASFDAYGNIVSDTDVNGRVTTIAYSSTYQHAYPTQVTYNGSSESYAYNFATGLETSVTDPRGLTTTYAYDLVGRVVRDTQPAVGGSSPTTNYVYDDAHNTVTVYDPDSLPRVLAYDMETLSGGSMQDLSGHGLAGTLYGTTGVAGEVGLARQFNGTGARIQSTGSLTASTSLTISAWVNRDPNQTDTLGDVFNGTTIGILKVSNTGVVYAEYYGGGAWHTVASNTKVSASTWTYVAVTFAPGLNGVTYVDIYINGALDANSGTVAGQPSGSYSPTVGAGSATSERFKGIIDEVQVFNLTLSSAQVGSLYHATEGGRYVQEYFDGLGRLTREVERSFFSGPSTAGFLQATVVDNWRNQVVTQTNPNGSVHKTVYDFLGRVTTETNPGGSNSTISYDDLNLTVTTTDEMGRETQDVYDVGGRLIAVRQYSSSTTYNNTTYRYDLSGELIAVTDELGATTRNTYDDAGNLVRTAYPDGTNETYVYDNLGNVISVTDQAGRLIKNTYNAFNELTDISYPGGRSIRYSYDADGNLRSVISANASLYYYYDNLNRVISATTFLSGDSTNYTVAYQYDAVGNVLNMTYPNGQGTLAYAYNAFYQITSMSFNGTTVASFTYRNDGLPNTITFGDGSVQTYTYSARGFPLEDKVTSGSTTLMDLKYTENTAGDVTSLANAAVSGDTENYSYDKQDRLLAATGPWGTISYTYDSAGNRLSMVVGSTTTTYHYGSYDELTSSVMGSANTTFAYDANGNIISRTTGATTNTYSFDVNNELYKAVVSGSTYTFVYDGLGDRVREAGPTSGNTLYNNTYIFSGGFNVYLKNVVGTSTTKTIYIYAGSEVIASQTGAVLSYFHGDALGNTRLVTQSNGHGGATTVFSTNYEPFGAQYSTSGTNPNVDYSGQWLEAAGLYWEHARFYDPSLGRFISLDPSLGHLGAPQTLNRYAYAVNNPELFADPSGLDCSYNPGTWLNCAQGAGQAIYNGAVGAGQWLVNDWNNGWNKQSPTMKIILTGMILIGLSVATLGAADIVEAPALAGALWWAGGLSAIGTGLGAVSSYAFTGSVSPTWMVAGWIVGFTVGFLYGSYSSSSPGSSNAPGPGPTGAGGAGGAAAGEGPVVTEGTSPTVIVRVFGGRSPAAGGSWTTPLGFLKGLVQQGGVRSFLGIGSWNSASGIAIGFARPGTQIGFTTAAPYFAESLAGGGPELLVNPESLALIIRLPLPFQI